MDKPLLRALSLQASDIPPVWFMRQAGRYLPEYRELRAKAGGFLNLVYTPEMAAEVTLQPIRRFSMDGAILFSDILVVPHALGVDVRFETGEGPVVERVDTPERIAQLATVRVSEHCAPIAETLRLVKKELPSHTTLIGFAGAPWTVACYMVEGKGSKDYALARGFAYAYPDVFSSLMDKLIEATVEYLVLQVEAGAEAVQLFDSWAGVLSPAQFARWVIEPNRRIVEAFGARCPQIPVIAFPRGAAHGLREFHAEVRSPAISIDYTMPMEKARKVLPDVCLQGNLDPLLLASDKGGAVAATRAIKTALSGTPYIFNLGHGIVPHTPIAHVEAVLEAVRSA